MVSAAGPGQPALVHVPGLPEPVGHGQPDPEPRAPVDLRDLDRRQCPPQSPFKANFLQMMQCYGDANTGPTPEQCEYGSAGLLRAGVPNAGNRVGSRGGQLCVHRHGPSTDQSAGTAGRIGPSNGCDPPSRTDPDPRSSIPPGLPRRQLQRSVHAGRDSTDQVYGTTTEFYDQFNTNEVQEASTGADGTGQQFFQTLTATEAPGLGCGALEADGKPRDCWLVIVPRGEYEPNGWKISTATARTLGLHERVAAGRLDLGPAHPDPPRLRPAAAELPDRLGQGARDGRHRVGRPRGLLLAARAQRDQQLQDASTATPRRPRRPTPRSSSDTERTAGLAFTTMPIGSEARPGRRTATEVTAVVYAPMTGVGHHLRLQHQPDRSGSSSPTDQVDAAVGGEGADPVLPLRPARRRLQPSGPGLGSEESELHHRDPEFQKLNPGIVTPPSGSAARTAAHRGPLGRQPAGLDVDHWPTRRRRRG